jgi:hypothetical protein
MNGYYLGRRREENIWPGDRSYQWLAPAIHIWTVEGMARYYFDVFWEVFIKCSQLRGLARRLAADNRADLGSFVRQNVGQITVSFLRTGR